MVTAGGFGCNTARSRLTGFHSMIFGRTIGFQAETEPGQRRFRGPVAAHDETLHHLDPASRTMLPEPVPTLQAEPVDVPDPAQMRLSPGTAGSDFSLFSVDTHMDGMVEAIVYYASMKITIMKGSGSTVSGINIDGNRFRTAFRAEDSQQR